MTVSSVQRGGLSRAVSRLRVLFEDDYADVLEGTFGIHVSGRRAGEIEDASALSLSAHELAARQELVGVVEYLRGEGLDAVEAVERLLREATFTTVNRLLAVRVAEAIGVLPPSLVEGRSSLGFVETVEVFPLLRDADSSGGYWAYLQVCGDELSHAVPKLFDRRHPLSVLEPSSETLDAAVEILFDAELAGVWVEPEALGWSYQFFNTQEERKKMRDESSAPRDSRELAVRNQFFTPSYVVDFLVENTLGRRLRESGSELELPLLIGEIDDDAPSLDLSDVSVLDPAVGSGHFLLGTYDLLERAWQEQGVSPADAAPTILGSLFGVDIDPRAAQVAQAVLYLRARRSAPDGVLDPPRIVTARSLPKDTHAIGEVLADVSNLIREAFFGLDRILDQAGDLGSLLKPEKYLKTMVGSRLAKPKLGDQPIGDYAEVEAAILAAVGAASSRATSTAYERLFAADAADGLRFLELCARRYDTVLMNPPFGRPIQSTIGELRKEYEWIPSRTHDLFALFVGRGLDLLKPTGCLGAITSRSGFFLKSFESWRRQIVLGNDLVTLADLGHGVMEDALVEAAAYVLRPRVGRFPSIFVRLLRSVDKGIDLERVCSEVAEDFRISREVFVRDRSSFESIPTAPIAYWVPASIGDVFSNNPPLETHGADVRVGLQTSNDFRFVRTMWEIAPASIASSVGDTYSGHRWAPFAKGGEYSPFYSDLHLVVNWEQEGAELWNEINPKLDKPWSNIWMLKATKDRFFQPGVTWPVATTSAFGPYAFPAGAIFGHAGCVAFPVEGVAAAAVGAVLSTRYARHFMSVMLAAGEETSSGTPRNRYEVGVVQRMPWAEPGDSAASAWLRLARYVLESARVREISPHFLSPLLPILDSEHLCASAIDLALEIDRAVALALGLDTEVVEDVNTMQGPHPGSYPMDVEIDQTDFEALYELPIDKLVDVAVTRAGGARFLATKSYFLDRRTEVLAHVLHIHPRQVVALGDELELSRPVTILNSAASSTSYLAGCALGRWDVRVGRDPSLAPPLGDPFDPLPVCSPGMLTGDDGLPVVEAPSEYPISLPPARILHDDPGHEWDIVERMEDAAEFLFDDPDGGLSEALGQLKVKDLRSHLRGKFFAQHLSRYSKSRRKAPIYWYLAVPSKEWGLWVYAPWLSREQLFAIARASQDKMRRLADEASQLRRDVEIGGGRADRERLETVEALLEEVAEFHRIADGVAQSGWEPDLNDGIILNAAPLQELFADKKWRTDIEKHRKKMINGDYPWATVQTAYYDKLTQ